MLRLTNLLKHAEKIKIRLNLGIAKAAAVFRFVPEGPRHAVRDWLIRITTPRRDRLSLGKRLRYPMGINEYGFFRAQIGLAQGAKIYAEAIKAAGIPCTFINTDIIGHQEDNSLNAELSRHGKYAINVIHVNPEQIRDVMNEHPYRMFNGHYNIGVWLWELETIPETWIPQMKYVDEIWAPSEFIAKAIRKETDKPVTVIPYGIETPVAPGGRKDFGLPEEEFLVLAMYDSRSRAARKNPEGAILAFHKAFGKGKEKAALVLKVANGTEEEIAALKRRINELGSRCYLMTEQFSKPKLNTLIACCDVFLSLHRSEGFGLVIAEAMSLGVPVVATGWSANAEFMPENCTCRVGYRLIPVNGDYQHRDDSDRWAEPDLNEAAGYLRTLWAEPRTRREMAEEAARHIREAYSMERCAERIGKRYEQICSQLKGRSGQI